jgi:hypothetical protein
MGVMPFHVEVGPNWEVLEDFCNDRDRLITALVRLNAGADLVGLGLFSSKTLVGGPLSLRELEDHGRRDWFGMRQDAGAWHAQPPFDPVTNPTTGYWRQWYGDADGIVRTTLRRAAEISLGLQPGEDPERARTGDQHWPIKVMIKCTQPWFEGWVRWSRRPGVVVIIFAVPGNGHPLLTRPLSPPARSLPDYALDPTAYAGDEGLFVVTHEHETTHTVRTTEPSRHGEWTLPRWGAVYEGAGAVVTVSPCEADGGVLAQGRPFQP